MIVCSIASAGLGTSALAADNSGKARVDTAYVATLPELGQPADLIADSATESRLGQAFLRQLRASTPLYGDILLREYLENLVYRLSAHSPLVDPSFTLIVVDDREVNAFAVPGGVIGVNTGLMLTAETEDELAGVLSHELGHLSQRHFARSQEANKYNQWLALGGLVKLSPGWDLTANLAATERAPRLAHSSRALT